MHTLRYRTNLKAIFFSLVGSFLGLYLAFGMRNYRPTNRLVSAMPIDVTTPSPTITVEPTVTTSSQISSDGTKKLTMKTTNTNNVKTYAFSTSDGSGGNERVIFRKTVTGSFEIPFNSWSPDNKYFFIEEHDADGTVRALVFKASGETFDSGEQFLDVAQLFTQRGGAHTFQEATGWASETLLIFNTTTQNNATGPSFWFEVPSGAIMQLGTQF